MNAMDINDLGASEKQKGKPATTMHSAPPSNAAPEITKLPRASGQNKAMAGSGDVSACAGVVIAGDNPPPSCTVVSTANRTLRSHSKKLGTRMDAIAGALPFIDEDVEETSNERSDGRPIDLSAAAEETGKTNSDDTGGGEVLDPSAHPASARDRPGAARPNPSGRIIDDDGLYEVCLNDEDREGSVDQDGCLTDRTTAGSVSQSEHSSTSMLTDRRTSSRNPLLRLVSPKRLSHLRNLSIFSGKSSPRPGASNTASTASSKSNIQSVRSSPLAAYVPPTREKKPTAGSPFTHRPTHASVSFDTTTTTRHELSKPSGGAGYPLKHRKAASSSREEKPLQMSHWMFGVRRQHEPANDRLRPRRRAAAATPGGTAQLHRSGTQDDVFQAQQARDTVEGTTTATGRVSTKTTPAPAEAAHLLRPASPPSVSAEAAASSERATAAGKYHPGAAQEELLGAGERSRAHESRSRPAMAALMATTRHVAYLGRHARRTMYRHVVSMVVCGAWSKPRDPGSPPERWSPSQRAKQGDGV